MANPVPIMRDRTRKLDTLYNAVDEAADLMDAIGRAADRLRSLMERAHGHCRVQIDHEHGLAMVARSIEPPLAKPKRGVVA